MRFLALCGIAAMMLTACGSPAGPAGEAATPAVPAVSPTAPADSTPSPPPPVTIETPAAITLADTVPDGAWNGDETITKVKGNVKDWWNPVPKKGMVFTDGKPWVFSSTCTDTLCTGTIVRETDGDLPSRDFTWDGTTLKITREPWKETLGCETDGQPNGGKFKTQMVWTYDVKVDTDADGRVTKIMTQTKITAGGEGKLDKKRCGSGIKSGSQNLTSDLVPVP